MGQPISEIKPGLLDEVTAEFKVNFLVEEPPSIRQSEQRRQQFHWLRQIGIEIGRVDIIEFEQVSDAGFQPGNDQMGGDKPVPGQTRVKAAK